MKILLIAYYYTPMNNGGVQRPKSMVKYLEKFGHEVKILTHIPDGIILNNKNEIRIDGNHKLKHLPYRVLRKSLRLLGYMLPSIWEKKVRKELPKIIKSYNPDLIIGTYPPLDTFNLIMTISQEYNIPVISDFRDGLMFESIEDKSVSKPKLTANYASIEAEVVNSSSLILTVSPPITNYINEHYNVQKAITVTNGFDEDDYNKNSENNIEDKNYFSPQDFNIVYTGRFSFSDSGTSVECFLDAYRGLLKTCEAEGKSVKLHLFGEYSDEEINFFTPFVQDSSIIIHGMLDRNDILTVQMKADLLLLIVNQRRTSVATGKIFEYLRSNKPILALAMGTFAGQIISDTKTGWVVNGEDRRDIYDCLRYIVLDESSKKDFTPKEDIIQSYSRERQLSLLNDKINEIIIKKVYQ